MMMKVKHIEKEYKCKMLSEVNVNENVKIKSRTVRVCVEWTVRGICRLKTELLSLLQYNTCDNSCKQTHG